MKKNLLLSRISKFKPINLSNHMNKIKIFIKKKKKKFNNKYNNKTSIRIKELRKSTTYASVNLLNSPPCNSSSSYNEEVKFLVDDLNDDEEEEKDKDDNDDDDNDDDDSDDDVIIPNTITKDVVVTDEDALKSPTTQRGIWNS